MYSMNGSGSILQRKFLDPSANVVTTQEVVSMGPFSPTKGKEQDSHDVPLGIGHVLDLWHGVCQWISMGNPLGRQILRGCSSIKCCIGADSSNVRNIVAHGKVLIGIALDKVEKVTGLSIRA